MLARACCLGFLIMPCMAAAVETEENLFEFLAGLEKVDGRWIDPMQLPPLEAQLPESRTGQDDERQDDDQ